MRFGLFGVGCISSSGVTARYPYPSNELRDMLRYLADPDKYRDIYGLRYYEGGILKYTLYCYSAYAERDHNDILSALANQDQALDRNDLATAQALAFHAIPPIQTATSRI